MLPDSGFPTTSKTINRLFVLADDLVYIIYIVIVFSDGDN